jgi:glucose/arabinose dehydrogenase
MYILSWRVSRLGAVLAVSAICVGALAAPYESKKGTAQGANDQQVLRGKAAFGDWHSDHPGVSRLITAADLPKPYATPSARNFPRMAARPEGALPQAPPGFKVERLATGIRNPRLLRTAPDGDIFIANSEANEILVMHGVGQGGGSVAPQVFATGLSQPFGIAFYPPGPNPKFVYVGNTGSVVRFPYRNGDLKASGPAEMIVSNIPSSGRLAGGGHWTRDVIFSADGKKMYVSVGSHSNVSDDAAEARRADILEFNPDGSGERVYASGIRNAVGITFDPATGVLWASVNERDEIGDDVPPDYVTHVKDGGFYGWPWYYIGGNQDQRHAGKHPELKSKVIVPDVLVEAHSASLQMVFYSGNQFPAEYRSDAFAAEHGSWNREKRTGYKIIRVPMKDGKATGEYIDFVTGFVTAEGNVWGRPVGVTIAADGSLIFSEDGSGSIWRVGYGGGK